MKEKALKKGQTVFWQGDPGDCMYYIRWGSVGVYANYATSRQRKLAELRQGDYFGEMGLLEQEPRSATVVTLESGTLLTRIGEQEFGEFFLENPTKVLGIMQRLCHKLRDTTRAYRDACEAVDRVVGNAGKDAADVDETSDYGFSQDERLRAIHDRHQAELAATDEDA